MTRARNIAGFSTITTTPSPVHVGPIGVLTATRIDGEFGDRLDISARNLTVAGIAATHLQVSGITTGLNVSGIITAQNGINFNGTSTGLNVSGVGTIATLSVTGNATVGGVLTYEDVTRVDSVGVITAREQVHVGTGVSIAAGGLNVTAGISTFQAVQGTTGTFSGDVSIADKIVHTGDTNTAIRFPSADNISFETDGSERVRIKSSLLGINTTSESISGMSRYLSISARNVSNGGSALEIVGNRTGGDQTLGVINFVNDASNVAQITAKYQGSTTSGSIQFLTSGSERLRIESNGNVGVNTDFTGSQSWRNGQRLEIFGGGGNVTGELHLGANRGDGAQAVGSINFFDNTQDSNHKHVAIIEVDKSGSTANKRGGDIKFYTKNDNVAAPTQKLDISRTGNITIGTASDAGGKLYFQSTSGAAMYIASGGTNNQDLILAASSADEYLRVDSSGNMGLGAASITANTNYNTLQIQGQSGSGGGILRLMTTDGSTSKAMIFADTAGLELRQETNHKIVFSTNNTERARIQATGELSLRRGGISAIPSLEIYGSGNHSDSEADDLRFHNWGNSDGDYWQIGVNSTLDGNGNNAKPSTSTKGAAIRLNAKNGKVTLITSPSSTSTQYEGLTQNELGHHTNANQPVFSYRGLGNTQTGSRMTNDGDMLFNTAIISSSYYDTSNGRFTAPTAGKYYFQVNALLDDNAGTGIRVIRAKVNGSIQQTIVYNNFNHSGSYYHVSGGTILNLSVNDYVTFFASEGFHVGSETNVSGFLVT